MATEQTTAAMRRELRGLSDGGTSLAELLDHLGEQNRRQDEDSFSDDQEEELQLYCWALHKGQSSGALWGRATVLGGVDDDIGA
jgi:hypothetical protein